MSYLANLKQISEKYVNTQQRFLLTVYLRYLCVVGYITLKVKKCLT